MNLIQTKTKLLAGLALGLIGAAITAQAAIVSINTGVGGSNTERGIVFNLTNTSTTDTIALTGVFNLPITLTTSVDFSLWIREGTVVGNVGPGATNWTDFGDAVATGLGYSAAPFNLTPFNFTAANGYTIEPGETVGIFIKNSSNAGSAALRYINGGSNTVLGTEGFTNGGLQYTGDRGLGSTGLIPTETNNFFGPTRNFIGTIEYTVVPEPSVYAFMLAGALCGIVWLRRRKGE